MVELELSGLKAIRQHPVKVCYRERSVGDYIADIVVEDKVVIELKSIEQLNKVHKMQLINYLKATNQRGRYTFELR